MPPETELIGLWSRNWIGAGVQDLDRPPGDGDGDGDGPGGQALMVMSRGNWEKRSQPVSVTRTVSLKPMPNCR